MFVFIWRWSDLITDCKNVLFPVPAQNISITQSPPPIQFPIKYLLMDPSFCVSQYYWNFYKSHQYQIYKKILSFKKGRNVCFYFFFSFLFQTSWIQPFCVFMLVFKHEIKTLTSQVQDQRTLVTNLFLYLYHLKKTCSKVLAKCLNPTSYLFFSAKTKMRQSRFAKIHS